MEIRRIVIGVDGSRESEAAVKHGLNIARHLGADIVLLHAGEIPPAARPAGARAADTYELLAREELAETRRMLEEVRERISGQGVEVSHMVVPGFPDTGISEAAIELGAGLAVVGTHAARGLRRFLLGSVAETVVRIAETDVLVARSGAGDGRGGYHNILVATDFGPACERALALALALAARGAKVELLHCWQMPLALSGYAPARVTEPAYGDLRNAIIGAIEREGRALVDRHGHPRVALSFRAVESSPGSGILARAEEYHPELIAVGSHGRHGLARLLLGSVSEKTVRRAHCSVLVAHTR